MKSLVFALVIFVCQLSNSQMEVCQHAVSPSGTIANTANNVVDISKCWTISVPRFRFVSLKFNRIYSSNCQAAFVEIKTKDRGNKYCETGDAKTLIYPSTVNITHIARMTWFRTSSDFSLTYQIKHMECMNKDSFHCNEEFCVPKSKVCDGAADCLNRADEFGCESLVLGIDGVDEARSDAIQWIQKKKAASLLWGESTPRVAVALYLSSGAYFEGTNLEEELIKKEIELMTATALLKSSFSSTELSTFINALLVTCNDPRHFYGNNLVENLKDEVAASTDVAHPLAYLTLCNANETWPHKANSDLIHYLNSSIKYPFMRDLQALSVMALSCRINNTNLPNMTFPSLALELYNNTIQDLKSLQQEDGSIGNVYTTSLITQALMSSGQENSTGWNLTATVKYLIKEIDSSSLDLLSIQLILPILNGKTLTDIFKVNCAEISRKEGNNIASKIKNHNGPKIRVKYSLYIGNEKEVIHSLSLRVPINSTAFEVMQLSETKDTKFRFEWKMMSGEIYMYGTANIRNDPEIGNFWLLYSKTEDSNTLVHLTTSPDKILIKDKDHLIYWYKTAIPSSN